jgi:hypothetical protein
MPGADLTGAGGRNALERQKVGYAQLPTSPQDESSGAVSV